MSADPISRLARPPRSAGDLAARLQTIEEGVRALYKVTVSLTQRQALAYIRDELAACRRAVPAIFEGAKDRMPSASPQAAVRRAKLRPVPLTTTERLLRNKNRVTADGRAERFCPRHDGGKGAWLPVECFDLKDRESGQLRYCCQPCWQAYMRERYVAANKRAIIVEVRDGDEIVGATCNGCGKPFAIGDLVIGTKLRHEDCGS